MINKKNISFISTLLIIIFHLWINVSTSSYENYLKYICVIGVDLFFFISAYSLATRKDFNYKKFLKNRFINIYFKFVIFAIIYCIYGNKSFEFFIKTILFINLFIKGGGSFLWFVPAIMLVYVLFPIYVKFENKNRLLSIILFIILYLGFTISLSYFSNYNAIFIFTNRLPILLLGYYYGKLDLSKYNKYLVIPFIIIGIVLSYWCYSSHLRLSYFYDVQYLVFIPLELGLIMLVSMFKNNKITDLIASSSLEVYAIQMIFGFKLASKLYILIKNALVSNIVTITLVILVSILLNKLLNLLLKKLENVL